MSLKNVCSLDSGQAITFNDSPDLHTLFLSFNKQFFENRLLGVDVYWSLRMTSSAGVCVYRKRMKYCCIRLSSPILKLRPHSDLVDTLLHEMIHAYLFVTNEDDNHGAHGVQFHKHMNRINKEAGTSITVFHSFHAEVHFHKQHWWRCDGPCQRHAPFYGVVKRAVNRAPGPSDTWWVKHLTTCGGSYIKIRNPTDNTKSNNEGVSNLDSMSSGTNANTTQNVVGFIDLTNLVEPRQSRKLKRKDLTTVFIDLTDKPNKKTKNNNNMLCPVCNANISHGSLKQHLETCKSLSGIFDDFEVEEMDNFEVEEEMDNFEVKDSNQNCPICSCFVEKDMKSHVDECLNTSGIVNIIDEEQPKATNRATRTEHKALNESLEVTTYGNQSEKQCPVCNLFIKNDFENHVDNCLSSSKVLSNHLATENEVSANNVKENLIQSNSLKTCPVCEQNIEHENSSHISDCLNNSFGPRDFNEFVYEISDSECETETKVNEITGSGETILNGKQSCPVCSKLVKAKYLTTHVDLCLNSSCSPMDFEEPIIVSDSESPVKLVGSIINVPMPKYFGQIDDSERRIACRECGLRFGVSMFAGHVCYPCN